MGLLQKFITMGQRPYSIRTRIKTLILKLRIFGIIVRDHIPLEQGLRLNFHRTTNYEKGSETIFH